MTNLEKFRSGIDRIDKQLVKLLNKRAELAGKIGKFKIDHRLAIVDSQREELILETVAASSKGPLTPGQVKRIFRTIIAVCRQLQNLTS